MIYASALGGFASADSSVRDGDMSPLFDAILNHVQPPQVDLDGPLQLQVSSLDYDPYVGVIGIGRVTRGRLAPNTPVTVDRAGRR